MHHASMIQSSNTNIFLKEIQVVYPINKKKKKTNESCEANKNLNLIKMEIVEKFVSTLSVSYSFQGQFMSKEKICTNSLTKCICYLFEV